MYLINHTICKTREQLGKRLMGESSKKWLKSRKAMESREGKSQEPSSRSMVTRIKGHKRFYGVPKRVIRGNNGVP